MYDEQEKTICGQLMWAKPLCTVELPSFTQDIFHEKNSRKKKKKIGFFRSDVFVSFVIKMILLIHLLEIVFIHILILLKIKLNILTMNKIITKLIRIKTG